MAININLIEDRTVRAVALEHASRQLMSEASELADELGVDPEAVARLGDMTITLATRYAEWITGAGPVEKEPELIRPEWALRDVERAAIGRPIKDIPQA